MFLGKEARGVNRIKLIKILLSFLIYLLVILLFGVFVILGKIEFDIYLIGKCVLVLAIIGAVQVTGIYKYVPKGIRRLR